MLIPNILVGLSSGGITGNLQSSTTIFQRRLLTTSGLGKRHKETRQDNLYSIPVT